MLKKLLSSKKALSSEEILQLDLSELQQFMSDLFDDSALNEAINLAQASNDFLATIVSYCKNPDYRQLAQQKLEQKNLEESKNLVLTIIQTTQFTDVRKWAVEQLSDETSLKAAYKWTQSKDKSTAKIIHQKLDVLKEFAKIKEQQQAKLSGILQNIEALSTAAYSPQYRGRYLLLVEQWKALDFEVSADDSQTFEKYRLASETALNSFQKVEEAHELQTATIEQLIQLWTQSQAQSVEEIAELMKDISLPTMELNWHQSVSLYQPEDPVKNTFHQYFQRVSNLSQWLQRLFKEPDYQQDYSLLNALLNNQTMMKEVESTEFIKSLKILREGLDKEHKQQKSVDDELVKQLDKQFGIAFHLKKQGDFKPIHNYIERINKKIPKLQQPVLIKKMQAWLETLETELKEVSDWTNFALIPKFERLCTEMETLIDLKMPVQKKAQAIQKLQRQWKTLGFMEGNDELWDRFKKAGDKAYEPCAEYFGQEKQYRDNNTQELTSLCEALELLLQHEELDGATLLKQVQLIDRSWYKKRDIDHKKISDLRERFKTSRAQIEERLETTYYDTIKAERQALIDRMARLVEGNINAHAENQVKLLQAAWKQTASLPKKLDNELWTAFKAQMDIFYQKRRDQNQEKRQQANQPLQQAKAIIDELRELVKTASDEKRFHELQQQFNALTDLDGNRGSDFKKQFQQLGGKLEKQVHKNQQQSRNAEIDELKRRAQLCTQLETGSMTAEVVEEQWNQQELKNNQWLQRINKRFEQAKKGVEPQTENPHRRMCINIEIALGLETPASDKSLRMAIQMELLKNRGLQGDKVDDKKAYLLEKQVEWFT